MYCSNSNYFQMIGNLYPYPKHTFRAGSSGLSPFLFCLLDFTRAFRSRTELHPPSPATTPATILALRLAQAVCVKLTGASPGIVAGGSGLPCADSVYCLAIYNDHWALCSGKVTNSELAAKLLPLQGGDCIFYFYFKRLLRAMLLQSLQILPT